MYTLPTVSISLKYIMLFLNLFYNDVIYLDIFLVLNFSENHNQDIISILVFMIHYFYKLNQSCTTQILSAQVAILLNIYLLSHYISLNDYAFLLKLNILKYCNTTLLYSTLLY